MTGAASAGPLDCESLDCTFTATSGGVDGQRGLRRRLLGNQSARVFLERDGGTHQCELIMINDEALAQTKIPDHEPEERRLPGDRGQHGQRGLQHDSRTCPTAG